VTWKVNGSNKCKLDTITASGTFRLVAGGPGGTVHYKWIRKDSNGTWVSPDYTIVVAAGDSAAHAVASDSWIPASNGSEQLVFSIPSYTVAPQSFTCRP
jgi:hypothetical protein